MVLIVCISDLTHSRHYLQIKKVSNGVQENFKNINASDIVCNGKPLKRYRLLVDAIAAFYLLREIQQFAEIYKRICAKLNQPTVTPDSPLTTHLSIFYLKLVPPEREIIDFKWNQMLAHTLWEKIEADYLMSWLSTLGGGFSALGEQFTNCAETAGKISLKQLWIGIRLGDPFLQARCKLYYSISLIQTGRLRAAKYIVREQYKFALPHKSYDGRLVKMCKGIWHRIQYEYRLKLNERARLTGAGDK